MLRPKPQQPHGLPGETSMTSMLSLYTPAVRQLAAEQVRAGVPMVCWLGDSRPENVEARVIAAQLAHITGGALFIDGDAV